MAKLLLIILVIVIVVGFVYAGTKKAVATQTPPNGGEVSANDTFSKVAGTTFIVFVVGLILTAFLDSRRLYHLGLAQSAAEAARHRNFSNPFSAARRG